MSCKCRHAVSNRADKLPRSQLLETSPVWQTHPHRKDGKGKNRPSAYSSDFLLLDAKLRLRTDGANEKYSCTVGEARSFLSPVKQPPSEGISQSWLRRLRASDDELATGSEGIAQMDCHTNLCLGDVRRDGGLFYASDERSIGLDRAAYLTRYSGCLLGGMRNGEPPPEDTGRFRGDDQRSFLGADGPRLLQAVIPAALTGTNHGYDMGATTAALMNLRNHGPPWGHKLVGANLGRLLSVYGAGELCGGLLAYVIGRRVTSRQLLLASACIQMQAGLLYGLASDLLALALARFAHGIGSGIGLVAAPQYIAEISPREHRGAMVSLKETMIMVGLMFGACLGLILVDSPGGWHYAFTPEVPLAIVQLAGIYSLSPESPRQLSKQGRRDEARDVLRDLRPFMPEEALEEEFLQFHGPPSSPEEEEAERLRPGPLQLANTDARVRRALLAGCTVSLAQQLTGHPTLQVLSTSVFQQLGFHTSKYAQFAATSWMFAKLGFSVLALDLADQMGRRPLLTAGFAGLGATWTGLALAFVMPDQSGFSSKSRLLLGVAAMTANAGVYQASLGPLTWVINSEIYPLDCRAEAISLSLLSSFIGSSITGFVLPVMQDKLGSSGAYTSMAMVCALFYAVGSNVVFETQGLALEEIEQLPVEDRQNPEDVDPRTARSSGRQ